MLQVCLLLLASPGRAHETAYRTAVLGPAMIRFDVSALVEARPGATLNLDIDTGPSCLADLEVSFLRGAVGVTRVENGLLVQGAVDSQLRVDCVRCLKSFDLAVALELEEIFRLPGTSPISGMSYGVTSNGWLDLAPLLRELVWLTVPLKPLCGCACRGLCSGCGADLNTEPCTCEDVEVDPRWAALRDLVL